MISFSLSRLPRIHFGAGRLHEVPALAAAYGDHALLVTGRASFCATAHFSWLTQALAARGVRWSHLRVGGEPSPQLVDDAVRAFHPQGVRVVVGIGGGSVLDAAKAIAGLLPHGNSVLDHLEGVGRNLPYQGPATPFVAVPTTAGTGSEATKNAVLSVQGPHGFKKSFRDEQLIPEWAILDPDLLTSCPPALLAADGMDAFTQLLESYVSSKANPLTDALAWSGLEAFNSGFWDAWSGREPVAARGRAHLAYAALLSGVTLAQVGLGSVHGLASPLGAFHPIPHGVVCGTLVAAATQINIAALSDRQPDHPALAKYARVGRLLGATGDDRAACAALVTCLEAWTEQLDLPRLGAYGITAADLPHLVAHSRGNSMQTNPIRLTDEDITRLLRLRL